MQTKGLSFQRTSAYDGIRISNSEATISFKSDDEVCEVDVKRKQKEDSISGTISIYVNEKRPTISELRVDDKGGTRPSSLFDIIMRQEPSLCGRIRTNFRIHNNEGIMELSKLDGDADVIKKLVTDKPDIKEPIFFAKVISKFAEMEGDLEVRTEDQTINHYLLLSSVNRQKERHVPLLRNELAA